MTTAPYKPSQLGVIISSIDSRVIGTFFTKGTQLGFHCRDEAFRKTLDQIHQEDVLYTDGNFVKNRTLQTVPFNYIRNVFNTHGYLLLTQEEFAKYLPTGGNPGESPSPTSREDTYYRGAKHYIFRQTDHTAVGVIWMRPSGSIFDAIIDDNLQRVVTPSDRLVDIEVPSLEESPGMISTEITQRPLNRLSIFELQDALAPDYYVVPAGYVETVPGFVTRIGQETPPAPEKSNQ